MFKEKKKIVKQGFKRGLSLFFLKTQKKEGQTLFQRGTDLVSKRDRPCFKEGQTFLNFKKKKTTKKTQSKFLHLYKDFQFCSIRLVDGLDHREYSKLQRQFLLCEVLLQQYRRQFQ